MIPAKCTTEQRELFRIAAQRVLDAKAYGRKTDPHAVEWAQDIIRTVKPIGRPLSTGEPDKTRGEAAQCR